jgi:hypothetical protein
VACLGMHTFLLQPDKTYACISHGNTPHGCAAW